jgi:hypothetical protein
MDGFGSTFDAFLDPGERLLWSGQPKQGLRFRASDLVQIPFSLFWCGFVVVWETMALQVPLSAAKSAHHSGTAYLVSWLFPLWGVPFLVIGLHMLIGRFFYDAAMRKRTWYALTDQRLIILKGYFSTSVSSFDHASLTNLNLVERTDGTGDILFGTPFAASPLQDVPGSRSRRAQVPGFYDLSGARNIYNEIRAAQNEARK